jgi:hypothetical protein
MSKKKSKTTIAKNRIWMKFVRLPWLEKYDLVIAQDSVYDDFFEMLNEYKHYFGSLKELEKDIDERRKLARKRGKV